MLVNMPKHIFEKKPDQIWLEKGEVVIATGFGCDPGCEIPIRLPSYALPAIALQETLSEMGVRSTIEFYFAEHYSAKLREPGNEQSVSRWTHRAKGYLEAYLQQFHPSVEAKVVSDRPINPEEWPIIDTMAQYLSRHGGKQIQQFAENRGGWTALQYMAAHSWYMHDRLSILQGKPHLQVGGSSRWDTVIMIGGPSEEIFYEARRVLQGMGQHGDWECLQLFTPIGRRPTYHRVDGEPTLDEQPDSALELLEVTKQAHRDLTFLLADASCDSDYCIVERRGGFTTADYARLENGWRNLRDLMSSTAHIARERE